MGLVATVNAKRTAIINSILMLKKIYSLTAKERIAVLLIFFLLLSLIPTDYARFCFFGRCRGGSGGGSSPSPSPSPAPADEDSPSGIYSGLRETCSLVTSLLGVAMMLMVVLAAITYAGGQVMGAETRARATVWATAMFTGAIIAALIYVLAPTFISTMTGLPVEQCQ